MKNQTLNLSRALKFRIHTDGRIYGRCSHSSDEFYIAPEIFAILAYFAQSNKEKFTLQKLQEFLKSYFKDILENLPNKTQTSKIITDLIFAGFLLDENENQTQTIQNDGFGDPWIQWAMVSDAKRSMSYERALEKNINKNSVVLDLGAGTGFLSAHALKLGAKKVYAIEESNISKSITPILKDLSLIPSKVKNSKKENFVLYDKNSYDVRLPEDINLVVSELFGNDPFQEGVYATLHDVANRIKNKNVQFIPQKLEVYGEVIDLLNHPTKPRIHLYSMSSRGLTAGTSSLSSRSLTAGSSVSSRDSITGSEFYKNFLQTLKKVLPFEGISFPIHLTAKDFNRGSAAVKLGECELNAVILDESKFSKYFSGDKMLELNAKTFDTPVFIFWFRVYLTDDISISSHPNEHDYACHWSPVAVVLNKTINEKSKLQIKYNLAPGNTAIECQIFENKHLIGTRL